MDPAELNKLTPEQKQQVMMNAQMEANTTIMQRMMEIMTKQCFTKCAGSSVCRRVLV